MRQVMTSIPARNHRFPRHRPRPTNVGGRQGEARVHGREQRHATIGMAERRGDDADLPADLAEVVRQGQVDDAIAEAAERLRKFGPNRLSEEGRLSRVDVLLRQVASPLQLLLVFAAIVAAATGEATNAGIVLTILCASAFIGYRREYSARAAAAALRARAHVGRTGFAPGDGGRPPRRGARTTSSRWAARDSGFRPRPASRKGASVSIS